MWRNVSFGRKNVPRAYELRMIDNYAKLYLYSHIRYFYEYFTWNKCLLESIKRDDYLYKFEVIIQNYLYELFTRKKYRQKSKKSWLPLAPDMFWRLT